MARNLKVCTRYLYAHVTVVLPDRLYVRPSVRPTDRLFICETTLDERKLCVLTFCGLDLGTLLSCMGMCAQDMVRCVRYGTGLLAWCIYVSTINMELQFRCHFQDVKKMCCHLASLPAIIGSIGLIWS